MSAPGRRRRRHRLAEGRAALSCGEHDQFVSGLLCRSGVTWATPGCARPAGGASRALGLAPVSAGLSAATAAALLVLLAVLVGWARRCAMLRRLGRTPDLDAADAADPERPLRSSLRQRRKRRRVQRLLRLRRHHVRFNESVDVNVFTGLSGTTLTSTSEGAPSPGGGVRGRHGSLFVSGLGAAHTTDDDNDEADEMSEPEFDDEPFGGAAAEEEDKDK
ncbi:hypothetical protein FJT64_004772 [Amphibalanus amphitrite]|uniref:Uncharacterized protein n=1 Tax=Amphibalanus amphitrite TaxID=1232801 RepID=A0A6A4VY44_AMPAM|nr:hypothetical protein FJT64_004772 [Amphibalanus amphitrite]